MVQEILAYKIDSPEHWKVYGLGKRGSLSGQIFPNVTYVDEFPLYCSDVTYGMDIGFTNSPTTLVKIGQADGFIYGQELLHERGLLDPDIVDRLNELKIPHGARLLVDSAAPMVIEYLQRYGDFNAIACAKKDVKNELQAMKRFKWRLTNDSTNWKKEARNYVYKRDKSGGLLNEPTKAYDHLFDAARYAFLDIYGGNDGNFFF
jgi:phage terminase large subunit